MPVCIYDTQVETFGPRLPESTYFQLSMAVARSRSSEGAIAGHLMNIPPPRPSRTCTTTITTTVAAAVAVAVASTHEAGEQRLRLRLRHLAVVPCHQRRLGRRRRLPVSPHPSPRAPVSAPTHTGTS